MKLRAPAKRDIEQALKAERRVKAKRANVKAAEEKAEAAEAAAAAAAAKATEAKEAFDALPAAGITQQQRRGHPLTRL